MRNHVLIRTILIFFCALQISCGGPAADISNNDAAIKVAKKSFKSIMTANLVEIKASIIRESDVVPSLDQLIHEQTRDNTNSEVPLKYITKIERRGMQDSTRARAEAAMQGINDAISYSRKEQINWDKIGVQSVKKFSHNKKKGIGEIVSIRIQFVHQDHIYLLTLSEVVRYQRGWVLGGRVWLRKIITNTAKVEN